MRLGFAVKVLAQPGLKSNDTRRWQSGPHLSVSLAYLRDILVYLQQAQVQMYRMSSDLAPYVTHPDMPQFHGQIQECALELAAIGQFARQSDIRLSLHPAAHVVLDAWDEQIAAHSVADLVAQAEILDRMELGPDAVVVTHVGGLYGNRDASLERFAARYEQLPAFARRRVVIENDERAYSIGDTYRIHQRTGARLVIDVLHYACNPTLGLSLGQALRVALGTWPDDQVPKIHFSSPCTALGAHRTAGLGGRVSRL
jgi:UV DNA damage endonuclease